MDEGQDKPRQTRRKRRVEGSATPPRREFVLRLEKSTFDDLNVLLDELNCSRNQYIERLIEFDLAYRKRIGPLNGRTSDLDHEARTREK